MLRFVLKAIGQHSIQFPTITTYFVSRDRRKKKIADLLNQKEKVGPSTINSWLLRRDSHGPEKLIWWGRLTSKEVWLWMSTMKTSESWRDLPAVQKVVHLREPQDVLKPVVHALWDKRREGKAPSWDHFYLRKEVRWRINVNGKIGCQAGERVNSLATGANENCSSTATKLCPTQR